MVHFLFIYLFLHLTLHLTPRDIIDQVMALHIHSRYLHIGCDEVFSLGQCGPCAELDSTNTKVFVDHVKFVAEYARERYNVTPIIWDDMLRHLYYHDLRPLGSLVQPMVWVYADQVDQYISNLTWHRYSTVFQSPVWAASAFKGASGETALIPEIGHHVNNNVGKLQGLEFYTVQGKWGKFQQQSSLK